MWTYEPGGTEHAVRSYYTFHNLHTRLDKCPAQQSRDNKHIIGEVVNWDIVVFNVFRDLFSQVSKGMFTWGQGLHLTNDRNHVDMWQ